MRRAVGLLAAFAGLTAIAGLVTGGASAAKPGEHRLSNCLWLGPAAGNDLSADANFAFPDAGAVYWTAQIEMPAGSVLKLNGKFTHSRYQSLNSYGSDAAPTDALNDVSTRPAKGSRNPFLQGADRNARKRDYSVRILPLPAPADSADRRPNTLYAGVDGQAQQRLIYRVYLPDAGEDLTGGVGLPRPELKLADGTTLTGAAACGAVQSTKELLPLTLLPEAFYESLRDQPGKPETFPANDPPVFRSYYSTGFTISCAYQGNCGGNPERVGGQYSNIDNNYVSALVSRGFGDVLVLKGKLPRTPSTLDGRKTMRGGQMRYWSMCQNESLFTTKGAGCVYDEQIPIDAARRYTIVTSLPADRPATARRKCGVAFIPWPAAGDGDGHLLDGLLIVRNMLPDPGFKHAVQRTSVPGDEQEVMGPYYPQGTYTSKADFESPDCKS